MREKLKKLWDNERLRDIASAVLLFLMMLGLDASIRYIYAGMGYVAFQNKVPWLFTLAWAVMIPAALRLLPRIPRRIFTGFFVLLWNVLYITSCLMYSAKGNFFSFSSLMYAGDGFKFLDASYLHTRILVWLVLACGLISGVLSIIAVPRTRYNLPSVLVSLILIPLSIIAINVNREVNLTGRLEAHFDIYQDSLIYDDFSDSVDSLKLAGLYQYTFRDFCLTYDVYGLFNRLGSAEIMAELDAWYDSRVPDPDNDKTGIFAGKNLIVIQLEATDTWMINEEFMPNLYAIKGESLDFTRHYTPLYSDAGTFNTEMIVNTGLVFPFIGSRASMFSRNSYPYSMANVFADKGYTAQVFHRSDGSVYNRREVHENLGYEKYWSGADMGIEKPDYDTELMRAYGEITRGSPFLSFIVTYSPHGPYKGSAISEEYYDWAAARVPVGTDPMAIHAYAHAWVSDLFIGELFQRLEEDGLLDDTVVVFYADHYDYYTLSNGLIMGMKGVNDINLITNTPFFIWAKDIEPETVDKVTSSYDVLPTLANLFGLDVDGTYWFGNDAFSENGGYVIFSDYSWFDGETYWNVKAGDLPTEEISAKNAQIRERLEMSWNTVKMDYFSSLAR